MKYLALTFLITFFFTSYASDQFEIKSHQKIQEFIKLKLKKYSPDEILVVFDIDNTVLAMNSNFGSDQWFQWQKEQLIENTDYSLAKDFEELITIQNEIFSLGEMHLTEEILINLIPRIQQKNITTIALTSRGPQMRNNTNKELSRNRISFKENPLGQSIGSSFHTSNGSRLVSYQDGIFMTSGMHKGEMLKYLLDLFKQSYKCIIFVDDHRKHTTRVYERFENLLDINTFRYGFEDIRVNEFKKSNKKRSISLGRDLVRLRNKF